jgi:hypothetical protein
MSSQRMARIGQLLREVVHLRTVSQDGRAESVPAELQFSSCMLRIIKMSLQAR